MKNIKRLDTQTSSHQNSDSNKVAELSVGNTNSNNTDASALLEMLKQMATEESNTLIRELRIRLLEPVETLTKRGNTITQMAWEYQNIAHDDPEWRLRKSPLYTDETQLLIEGGPYKEDAIYRVTAEKNDRGFWVWTSIEELDTDNDQLEGVA